MKKENYSKKLPLQFKMRTIPRLLLGGFSFSLLLFLVLKLITFKGDLELLIFLLIFIFIALRLLIESQSLLGLSFQNERIAVSKFIGNFIISSNTINTRKAVDVVILRFKMSQMPDYVYTKEKKITLIDEFNYEVHLLNKAHSNRNLIIALDSKEKAIKAAQFIEQHTTLFYTPL